MNMLYEWPGDKCGRRAGNALTAAQSSKVKCSGAIPAIWV